MCNKGAFNWVDALWGSVMLRALEDLHNDDKTTNKVARQRIERNRRKARLFYEGKVGNLGFACRVRGYDKEHISKIALSPIPVLSSSSTSYRKRERRTDEYIECY